MLSLEDADFIYDRMRDEEMLARFANIPMYTFAECSNDTFDLYTGAVSNDANFVGNIPKEQRIAKQKELRAQGFAVRIEYLDGGMMYYAATARA